MQFEFGSGVLVGVRQNDPGDSTTINTPREFGIIQECSVDFAATTKQLFGQYQFPVAVGRGTAKITGNAKFARIYGGIYNDLFFNGSIASGETLMAVDEAHTPVAITFTTTVTNTTNMHDLGVKDATTGNYLKKVDPSATPSTGQYKVNEGTGQYTFSAVDPVLITYSYTAAGGVSLTITNPLLGTAPSFSLHLRQIFQGRQLFMKLNRCISSKLAFATKLEDFLIPQLDFEAFADDSNQIGLLSTNVE